MKGEWITQYLIPPCGPILLLFMTNKTFSPHLPILFWPITNPESISSQKKKKNLKANPFLSQAYGDYRVSHLTSSFKHSDILRITYSCFCLGSNKGFRACNSLLRLNSPTLAWFPILYLLSSSDVFGTKSVSNKTVLFRNRVITINYQC